MYTKLHHHGVAFESSLIESTPKKSRTCLQQVGTNNTENRESINQ